MQVITETDSLRVSVGESPIESWLLDPVLHDIMNLFSLFNLCVMQWIRTEANGAADMLAKFCQNLSYVLDNIADVPNCVLERVFCGQFATDIFLHKKKSIY